MEKKLTIPSDLSINAYNQWVQLMMDKVFWGMVNDQKSLLEKLPNKKPTSSFARGCRSYIKLYLTDKKIPHAWITPIYNLITTDTLDFPLHNSISLFVGTQEVTGMTEALLTIKNIKRGGFGDKQTVSLVISSKVSADQIIQFIKEHKEEIEGWQDAYELPSYMEKY